MSNVISDYQERETSTEATILDQEKLVQQYVRWVLGQDAQLRNDEGHQESPPRQFINCGHAVQEARY